MNNEVKDILEKSISAGRLDGFDFAIFMQNLLISIMGMSLTLVIGKM